MRRSSGLTPEFLFDERSARYVEKSTGRFVASTTIRAALDRTLDDSAAKVAAATESLRAGAISLTQWQTAMMAEVKSTHLASASLAKGGWAQMSQADYGRAGQKIRVQYDYLRNFAAEVETGKQRLDGTLGRRAELYAQAGRQTYHAVEQREQARRGMTEEQNVISPGDNCPGCLEAEALGWVPIGTLPEIGTRDCLSRCRCAIEYR